MLQVLIRTRARLLQACCCLFVQIVINFMQMLTSGTDAKNRIDIARIKGFIKMTFKVCFFDGICTDCI